MLCFSITVALLIITFFISCNELEISSNLASQQIIIDGSDEEWKGSLAYIEEGKAFFGIRNDENFLYIVLRVWERDIQIQILRYGLTVWFDKKAEKNQGFGINFPLENKKIGKIFRTAEQNNRKEISEELLEAANYRMIVFGPEQDKQRHLLALQAETFRIETKIGLGNGNLIYELKIPLKINEDTPFAIGLDTEEVISICFETPEIDLEELKEDRMKKRPNGFSDGRKPGGGMPGRGIGKGGMGGRGMKGGMSGNMPVPERLQLWVTVFLADK